MVEEKEEYDELKPVENEERMFVPVRTEMLVCGKGCAMVQRRCGGADCCRLCGWEGGCAAMLSCEAVASCGKGGSAVRP